jgi:hypothetical protein
MISFGELHKKIERLYGKVLSAYVTQENIFPIIIAADKSLPDDFSAWTKLLEEIIDHSADRKQSGYIIEYETKETRRHGTQSLPSQFRFDDRNQFLGYLNKQAEFDAYKADVDLLIEAFPALKKWLAKNGRQVIQFHASWPGVMKVLQYFQANPRPALFARELPITVHTKFIEQHKGLLYELLNELLPGEAVDHAYTGLPQFEQRFGLRTAPKRIRLRMLDKVLAQQWFGGFTDLELTIEELIPARIPLQRAIILENKRSFENADIFCSIPDMQATAVLFGSGKAVALLAQLVWLQETQLLYWGDIDAEGFEILNMLRKYFPRIQSIFMDDETLQQHRPFVTQGNLAPLKPLNQLTNEEQTLYQYVCQQQIRLEQELLSNDYVVSLLRKIGAHEAD